MGKAGSNGASSRSQVTKDSGKRPSAKKLPTLPVGQSQTEASEIDTRRNAAIKQLELSHEESEFELLFMSQSVDGQGRPAGASRVSSVWPTGLDEWPGEDCRSLWQDTCDLVDAEFKSNEPDGGLSAWLFTRTQQLWMPTGIQAVVNDPLGNWLERLRSPDPTGPIVCSAMIVTSNPKAATAMDLLAVASKAHVLARVLRKQCDDVKRCENRIGTYRRDLQSESESLVELRDMFQRELASQVRLLRIERSTWRHWTGDAETVVHYASALIPDELSKCRQLSARTWNRPDQADWDELERELDLISSRLEWFPAPCKEGGILNVKSVQPELDDNGNTSTDSPPSQVTEALKRLDDGRKRLILVAMLELKATPDGVRVSAAVIARVAIDSHSGSDAIKDEMVTLKGMGLVDSTKGRTGGSKLTDLGLDVANELKKRGNSSTN